MAPIKIDLLECGKASFALQIFSLASDAPQSVMGALLKTRSGLHARKFVLKYAPL
jgi:hypothetical protein